MTLEIDVHEPKEAVTLMAPAIPCKVEVLNEHQWADYRWQTKSGRWVNLERKTWPEILANLNAVEDQLRRHKKNQPDARLVFVLEGMIASDLGGTYTLRETGNKVFVRGFKSGTNVSRVLAWLYSASEFVEVFQTMSYEMTCQFMVQAYKHGQKEDHEHQTFNRYFKKITFHPNPQVMMLMGLMPGLGEVKADALIDKFVTVWRVLNAKPEELMETPGIGKQLATTLLQRVGRLDV